MWICRKRSEKGRASHGDLGRRDEPPERHRRGGQDLVRRPERAGQGERRHVSPEWRLSVCLGRRCVHQRWPAREDRAGVGARGSGEAHRVEQGIGEQQLSKPRTVVWVSAGAASAVAAKLTLKYEPEAVLAYCETGAEHPDNERFIADLEAWCKRPVERLRSERYASTWDVWERRSYLAGIDGAPCTTELKLMPRTAWQQPTDIHVFGYTADASDVTRANRLRENYFELQIRTPLIDR